MPKMKCEMKSEMSKSGNNSISEFRIGSWKSQESSSGVPESRNGNAEIRKKEEFQIPGVGRVKTLHHQESQNHEMRNAEIPEEGGQFRIPGVGRVKTLHHQESRNREMRNAEIPKAGGQFRISGDGGIKTRDSSS
jgi:hypothetical protein